MEDEKSIRSFLAIDLPADVRNKIRIIQDKFRNTLQGSISWTRPEGIHLTLKFFVNIS
jgi:RNA 2',3'-cyclic 3'-phosphodiesterase